MMGPPGASSPLEADEVGVMDFATVFDREFSYVWNTLRRLGVFERDLEDVTHDVFLQVHRNLTSYDASRPVRPWLFAFAHRVAADYRRLARHRVVLVGDASAFESRARCEAAHRAVLASHEAEAIVRRALGEIPFDQRAVFILHDLEGHPMKAVAEALSIGVNTGYSRLRLARARFAVVLHAMNLDGSEP
jgi:RNA polymerase sigma-70 factor (ECF subfamily)